MINKLCVLLELSGCGTQKDRNLHLQLITLPLPTCVESYVRAETERIGTVLALVVKVVKYTYEG